ncbi:MAG: AAA family ATPase [Spirochaetales bacterium]|nr:AAA family ATPase [Spirochaetales bacterium]
MFQKYPYHCTEKCISALNIGIKEMVNMRKNILTPEFILVGLIEQIDSSVMRLLNEMDLNAEEARDKMLSEIYSRQEVSETTEPINPMNFNISISPEVEALFENALQKARELGDKYITASLLFVMMFDEMAGEDVHKILAAGGVNKETAWKAFHSLRSGRKVEDRNADSKEDVLSIYTKDLTALARSGKLDKVVGREEEIMQMIRVLSRRNKNNPILIGQPGVGKTVLVEALAQRIVDAEVPETLFGKKIVSLEMAELVAGAKFKGEFEERLKAIREEIIAASGQIILFIDEFHTVMSSSGQESGAASDMLKPALARGLLQCIGATTLDEYKKHIEKDKALARRLQPIIIDEPTVEETIEIIKGVIAYYQSHHSIKYTEEAIVAAARLSDRYLSERFLPDKAIDLIDEAGATKHLSYIYVPPEIKEAESKRAKLLDEQQAAFGKKDFKHVAEIQQKIVAMENELKKHKLNWLNDLSAKDILVNDADVAEVVSRWTGIPLARLVESESEKLSHMEDKIHHRIIGQDQAVAAVCNAIRRNRAGVKVHSRPIGSFLFLGPTGVGKTELAKALAEFLLDDENKIIRIDMSEYQERHTVSRIIGAPPGYIGYGEGGQLTEKVRRNPYSVILLDELEKAHPDVFNLLLQILDNGKLTDGEGLEVSFRNTLVIGTSNIGGQILSQEVKRIGFVEAEGLEGYEESKSTVMSEVKQFFRPEFLNRLDDIIVFHPLSHDHIRRIVDLEVAKLVKGLLEQNISLTVEDAVKDFLAETGYSEIYGARPLKREIERIIQNPISSQIIERKILPNSQIKAVLKKDKNVEIVAEK